MSVISEEMLKKDIKSKSFAPVYILFGEDTYLKKHYYEKLTNSAYEGDSFFNFIKFENEASLQDVYDAVMQFPLLADKKCVTFSDFDYLSCNKEDFEMFLSLIAAVPEGCTLVLRFDSVEFDFKKNDKAKKIVSAAEKIGGKAVPLNHKTIPYIAKTLTDAAAKRGCNLSDSNARYLIEISGDDLNILRNEIEKLCLYVGEGEIGKEIIDFVATKSSEASVFDYVKEVISGNVSSALKMLNTMLYAHIEPMVILYTVSSAYNDIYRVYSAKKERIANNQVSNDFAYKNKAFLLDRAAGYLRNFDANKINLSFKALLWADRALKSFGSDSAVILEELTVKLSCIAVKGESLD